MKKKKYTLGKKIHYHLDDFISKGLFAQLILLLAVAGMIVLIFGFILTLSREEANLTDGVWESLMHMIDQGTITGEDHESDNFLTYMLLLTFIGMAFTSTIIGIISSSIQEKMRDLRKGHSAIIEKDHVVIMGFNENTYTISREIAENGMRTRTRDCVVIVDNLEKDEMEHEAKCFQQDQQQFFEQSEEEKRRLRKSRLIFRSGDLISENTFEMCAVERSRAIIINRENDLETVKILLALVSYLKKNKSFISDDYMPSIVALIHDGENLAAAKSAAGVFRARGQVLKQKNENKIRILYYKEIFASLFAQACFQPGLPYVLDSMFNSHAASICIEKNDDEEQKQDSPFFAKNISEITEMLSEAIPIGFARTDPNRQVHVILNPGEDERFGKGDKLIYLSHKDEIHPDEKQEPSVCIGKPTERKEESSRALRHFLLIGWADALPKLVSQIREYCLEGSSADVISVDASSRIDPHRFYLKCTPYDCAEPYRYSKLKAILDEHPEWFDKNDPAHLTNIVILSGDIKDKAAADELVTVLLLNLRHYLQEKDNIQISITTEMYLPKDQTLMQNNSENDFVVASEISNRMMVQIAGDPRKFYIIEELLRQRGGAIYLRKVSEYIDLTEPFNFEGAFKAVRNGGEMTGKPEIPLGWVRLPGMTAGEEEDNIPALILAPSKTEREKVIEDGRVDEYERYYMVVMTEGLGGRNE